MTIKPDTRVTEVHAKLAQMRGWLSTCDAGAIRLRGIDWFAWATAGGSSAVLLTAEIGVAEILVTAQLAYLLTDDIEAQRLQDEEVIADTVFQINRWAEPAQRERFVRELAGGRPVFSDRPEPGESQLPDAVQRQRLVLCTTEQQRYRALGSAAAQAMTTALQAARPEWSEFELAGAGAAALWQRGIQPALVLVAGAQRLPRYRHATPSAAPLGQCAMMVLCGRRHGLYANLTRFVSFGSAPDQRPILLIEAAALAVCVSGQALCAVYHTLAHAYRQYGTPHAIREHHQGGITGYLAREVIATPNTRLALASGMALALNPSLTGIKIEDTFLLGERGVENLTHDPAWPTAEIDGRARPLWLELG